MCCMVGGIVIDCVISGVGAGDLAVAEPHCCHGVSGGGKGGIWHGWPMGNGVPIGAYIGGRP